MSWPRGVCFFLSISVVAVIATCFLLSLVSADTMTASSTGTMTMDPTAPVISGMYVDTFQDYAQIHWNTDDLSDSRVAFGTVQGSYTSFSEARCDGTGLVSSHCVYLSNLLPGTTYYFKVESRNFAGLDTHQASSFTTAQITQSGTAYSGSGSAGATSTTSGTSAATTTTTNTSTLSAPVISNVGVDDISAFAVRVKWNTDHPAESQVVFGTFAGSYPYTAITRCDGGGMVSSHCVNLSNLVQATQYFFRAVSRDAAGLYAASAENTFTTLFASTSTSSQSMSGTSTPADVPLELYNVRAEAVSSVEAQIRWDTNVPTDSRVIYGGISGSYLILSVQRCDGGGSVLSHCVYLTGLSPSTKYFLKASSKNTIYDEKSAELSFVTLAAAVAPQLPLPPLLSSSPSIIYQNLTPTTQTALPGVVPQSSTNVPALPPPSPPPQQIIVFDPEDREKILVEVKGAQESGKKAGSEPPKEDLSAATPESGTVLQSSIEDLALLIQSETGQRVNLSVGSRPVAETPLATSAAGRSEEDVFEKRLGIEVYQDTDRDGVSDFDEINVFETDPMNSHTGGSILTDGERVQLGLQVDSKSPTIIPAESPRVAGMVSEEFEVRNIRVDRVAGVAATSSVATGTPDLAPMLEQITFEGRGPANSFVTLYIFSTPIVVTVKADSSGNWKYTLASELEDGSHELYVANLDATGRILAKSPSIPFIKTAEAVEYTPLFLAATPTTDPLADLRKKLLYMAVGGIALVGLAALLILGMLRRKSDDSGISM